MLQVDYPWYFWIFCILAGAGYSALLYLRSKELSRGLRWALSVVRFLAVSLIALLLLAPVAKSTSHEEERPTIALALDNSQSLLLSKDSTFVKTEYVESLRQLIKSLEKKFDVALYSFGSTGEMGTLDSLRFDESATDVSNVIREIEEQYRYANLGAIVLASDGIYNQGIDPTTTAANLTRPIYTIALGDTTQTCDAALINLRHNRMVYQGDEFPLEITIKGYHLKGEQALLSIASGGKRVHQERVVYDNDPFVNTTTIMLSADHPGLQRYTIGLEVLGQESNSKNNTQTISVEVVDERQKIAIIGAAPHPDIAAIKQALQSNKNYSVKSFLASDNVKYQDYDLIIYHNTLPTKEEFERPSLIIVGRNTDLNRFNALRCGIQINTRLNKYNEVTATFDKAFDLFQMDASLQDAISSWPPLSSPFGDYQVAPYMQSLCHAKLGNIATQQPLIALGVQGLTRKGIIFGEGLWRWRLADFQTSTTHDHFDQMMEKIITFAAQRLDKSRFRVNTQQTYSHDEEINLEAELYDNNYELTNTPDVSITITPVDNPEAHEIATTMERDSRRKSYSLNLGQMAAGLYNYKAKTTYNNEVLTSNGQFSIEDLNLEYLNTTADHRLLRTLAETTGGTMVEAKEMEQIVDMIEARDDMQSVLNTTTRYRELINLPWVFLLIILLLGAEWVVRKYNGVL